MPTSLKRIFQDDRSFWAMLSILLGLFAILKGLRPPGLWAATQAQLNYSQGFIKRGLLGSLFNTLGIHHFIPISIAFFVILAIFFLTLIALTRRSGLTHTTDGLMVITAFTSSYAVTYLVHIVGYLDIPIGILAMALLLVATPRNRFLLGIPLVAVASLIHEDFLFLYAPVVLLSFVLDATNADTKSRHRTWLYGTALALYTAAFAALTSLKPNLTPAKIATLHATIAAQSDFPLRADIFPLMSTALHDNLYAMSTMPHNKLWLQWQFLSIFLLAPTLVLLIRFCLKLLPHDAKLLRSATLIGIFAPLMMHLVGWDAIRWNVLCILAAYLTLLVLRKHLPEATLVLSPAERNAILLVIAINMASGFGLFDRATVTPYPFFPKVLNWLWTIQHPGQPLVGL